MVHHRAEAGVVAAAARGEEVDARAVVVRVAGVRDVRVDRERGLVRDGWIGRVRRQHHVAHLVRLEVAVHLRGLRDRRGAVEGERGAAAVGDGLCRDGRDRVAPRLDHAEVAPVDRGCHAHVARAGVGDVEAAVGVGVAGCAADDHARIGQTLRDLGVARIGLGSVGHLAVHGARDRPMQDLALLVQDLARVGVDHVLHLLVIRGIPRTATGGDELDRQTSRLRIGVDACPHHVARGGHLRRRAELVHRLPRVDGRIHRGGGEIAPLERSGKVRTEILQRAATEHHREGRFVGRESPDPAPEHRHATNMLLPVHGGEGGVGAVLLVHELDLVRTILEWTDGLQLLEGHAPERTPVHEERLHAVMRRGARGEELSEHPSQLAANLDQRSAREGLVEPISDVDAEAGCRDHGRQQRRRRHGGQRGGTKGERAQRDDSSGVTHAILS